jgi:hypothetical protein
MLAGDVDDAREAGPTHVLCFDLHLALPQAGLDVLIFAAFVIAQTLDEVVERLLEPAWVSGGTMDRLGRNWTDMVAGGQLLHLLHD